MLLRLAPVALAVFLAVGFIGLSPAQIIVQEGGGGGFALGGGDHAPSVLGLLFRMTSDEGWQEAKTQLVTMAGEGQAVPIAYHAGQFRNRHGDKMDARIDALLAELETAGHYPLTQATIRDQIKSLEKLVDKLEGKKPNARVLADVAMSLHRATSNLNDSVEMIKTGKPKVEAGPGRMGGGGVIRRRVGGGQ